MHGAQASIFVCCTRLISRGSTGYFWLSSAAGQSHSLLSLIRSIRTQMIRTHLIVISLIRSNSRSRIGVFDNNSNDISQQQKSNDHPSLWTLTSSERQRLPAQRELCWENKHDANSQRQVPSIGPLIWCFVLIVIKHVETSCFLLVFRVNTTLAICY